MTRRDQNPRSGVLQPALASYLDAPEPGIDFSGVAFVSSPDGRVAAARGFANVQTGEPNSPSTRFNTASLTKFFTAVAVCRLLESDASAFDRAASVWLGKSVSAEFGAITVRELLVHTSGLPEQVPEEPDGVIGSDWLAPLAHVQLNFAPGSAWQYSNAGYSILGALIERATGMSYFAAMRTIVFDPVGMVGSGFEDTADAVRGRAMGYAPADPALPGTSSDTRGAGLGRGAPYGYAFSTIADVERLLRGVDEHSVVTPESARQILNGDTRTTEAGRYAGFGLFAEGRGSSQITTSAGAGPGISAWLDFARRRDFVSLVLANRPKPAAHVVGRWLRERALLRRERT